MITFMYLYRCLLYICEILGHIRLSKHDKYSYIITATSIKGSLNKFSSGIILISLSISFLLVNIRKQ